MQDVVMVDIETLGIGPTSVVLSIGVFSPQFTFHEYVDIDSQLTYGAQVNADTILWWMKQREEARLKQTAAVRLRMHVVLCNMYEAFQQASFPDGYTVWSNGASFDLPILRWHADRVGHKLPWEYWQERCYRTERARVPRDRRDEIDAEVTRILGKTVAHDALEDARRQHLWLQLAGVAR